MIDLKGARSLVGAADVVLEEEVESEIEEWVEKV